MLDPICPMTTGTYHDEGPAYAKGVHAEFNICAMPPTGGQENTIGADSAREAVGSIVAGGKPARVFGGRTDRFMTSRHEWRRGRDLNPR